MRLPLLVLIACFLPRIAHAESDRSPKPASPGVALALAAGATAAGGGMLLLASESEDDRIVVGATLVSGALYVVGPSAGHLYVGETGEAVGMSLIRAASVGVAYFGFTRMLDDCENRTCGERHGEFILLGGVGVWTVATVYDLIDAPRAAARANARMTIVPTGTGLAIAGSF